MITGGCGKILYILQFFRLFHLIVLQISPPPKKLYNLKSSNNLPQIIVWLFVKYDCHSPTQETMQLRLVLVIAYRDGSFLYDTTLSSFGRVLACCDTAILENN